MSLMAKRFSSAAPPATSTPSPPVAMGKHCRTLRCQGPSAGGSVPPQRPWPGSTAQAAGLSLPTNTGGPKKQSSQSLPIKAALPHSCLPPALPWKPTGLPATLGYWGCQHGSFSKASLSHHPTDSITRAGPA